MREHCRAESRYGRVRWGAAFPPEVVAGSEGSAPAASRSPRKQDANGHIASAAVQAIRDFDFLHGEWVVANRRALDPIAISEGWIAFDTVYTCRPLLNGVGNIDEVLSEDSASSAALRLFNMETRHWAVYRASSRDGVLQPPLRGGFEDGIGVFIGEDLFRDTPLLVRHTWAHTTPEKPRWEQAFSSDGGATWNTNWVMDLTRVDWA